MPAVFLYVLGVHFTHEFRHSKALIDFSRNPIAETHSRPAIFPPQVKQTSAIPSSKLPSLDSSGSLNRIIVSFQLVCSWLILL